MTVLVSPHYMDEAERCTDVGYIFMSKMLVLGKPGELKALPEVTPEGTRRYELRVPSATENLVELRRLEGVRDATLFGETVHVLVDQAVSPQRMLEQIGIADNDVEAREIPPSLEDVFVTLTAAAEQRDPSAIVEESAEPTAGESGQPAVEESARPANRSTACGRSWSRSSSTSAGNRSRCSSCWSCR